jgi:hypothetical protein
MAMLGWKVLPRIDAGFGVLVLAGLLVGAGTGYGSGCSALHLPTRRDVVFVAAMLGGMIAYTAAERLR